MLIVKTIILTALSSSIEYIDASKNSCDKTKITKNIFTEEECVANK